MTKVMLKNAPGGHQLIETMVAAVAEMSLAMAGEKENLVAIALDRTQRDLTAKLTKVIGARNAAELSGAFVAAVRGRRAAIEVLKPKSTPH